MKIVFVLLLATATAFSEAGTSDDLLYTNFIGKWTGHLEYRDYTSNDRVLLPTWLEVVRVSNGLRFNYIYDDGPNKVVRETSTLTLDPAKNTATFSSEGESPTTYSVAGLKEFVVTGSGKLVLTGTGTEKNEKVDVRITVTLRRNLYQYVKETRVPGAEFQFRDSYTFTRATPPQP